MGPSPCNQIGMLLSSRAADELAPSEAEEVEAHLATCPACRTQAEAFFRQDLALTELVAEELLTGPLAAKIRERLQTTKSPAARQRRMLVSWGFAAAASVAIVYAALALRGSRTVDSNEVAAHVQTSEGQVLLTTSSGESSVQQGQEIASGDTLYVAGEDSRVVVQFADGTRLEFGADTRAKFVSFGGRFDEPGTGKQVLLSEGFLTADVAKQPAGRPMVLSTPHAEIVVLGTKFNLSGGAAATYVETDEGSVRVTRKSDGASVHVEGGFEASVTDEAGPLTANASLYPLQSPRLRLDSYWTGSFSPDGQKLAVSSYLEGRVELCDVSTGHRQRVPSAHRRRIHAVAFSREGSLLATGGSDGIVTLWDRAKGEVQASLNIPGGWIADLSFTKDGRDLAVLAGVEGSEDRQVTFWDLDHHRQSRPPLQVTAVRWAFSPDGRLLAAADRSSKTVTLWGLDPPRQVGVLKDAIKNVFSMAFSHDGATLAIDSASGIVELWDIEENGTSLRQHLERRGGRIFGMAFSPDDRRLATGHQDGTVRVHDLETDDQTIVSAPDTGPARALAFSPDGRMLLARETRLATPDAPRDGAILIWDLQPEDQQ